MNDRRDAESLERRLQDAYRVEPPQSLERRLLAIPSQVPQAAGKRSDAANPLQWFAGWLTAFQWRLAAPGLAVIATVAVLWTGGLRLTQPDGVPDIDEATRVAQSEAIRDFVIVMNYLNSSTVRTQAAVQDELGTGLRIAFERGEQSFKEASNRVTNGG